MWDDGVGIEQVRFLPAAWLPRSLLGQLELALDQLLVSFVDPDSRDGASCGVEEAAGAIRTAGDELSRHAGGEGEPCLLTKEALFEVSGLLAKAGSLLAEAGLHAAALVAAAVDDRLVERMIEIQPMAPA